MVLQPQDGPATGALVALELQTSWSFEGDGKAGDCWWEDLAGTAMASATMGLSVWGHPTGLSLAWT